MPTELRLKYPKGVKISIYDEKIEQKFFQEADLPFYLRNSNFIINTKPKIQAFGGTGITIAQI